MKRVIRSALAGALAAALIAFSASAQRIIPLCTQQLLGIGNCAPALNTAITLVASTGAVSSDGNTVTTAPANMAGANFIVVSASYNSNSPTITDSNGNTWSGLTAQTYNRLYYCSPCITSSSQTFTAVSFAAAPAISVAGFSGVASPSPFDQQNGTVSGGFSTSPGSITPATNKQLVVSGLMCFQMGETDSVDSGYTIASQTPRGGNGYGTAIAYIVQTAAAATNPTWSGAANTFRSSTIASFKAR